MAVYVEGKTQVLPPSFSRYCMRSPKPAGMLSCPLHRCTLREPGMPCPTSNPLLAIYACATMRPAMVNLATAQQVCWDLSILLRVLLLYLVLLRRSVRSIPFFTSYLAINIAKALLVRLAYRVWGFSSEVSFGIAWGSEAIVICARALAVAETCRLLLSPYRGVWSLAWRLLLSCASLALLYSFLVSQHRWDLAILGANRGLELTIAVVVVVLLVFLRQYQVVAEPPLRALAVGFCLYSCFAVLNYTILERWLGAYEYIWNFFGVLSYLACTLVWTWALRKSFPRPVLNPALLPGSVYRQLSPEINLRLRLLNDHLTHFWRAEEPRS
jgi:hypothetical protein